MKYTDFLQLIKEVGFQESVQGKGSHQIFKHPAIANEFLNLQNHKGQAKPYQIKQFITLFDVYLSKSASDESA